MKYKLFTLNPSIRNTSYVVDADLICIEKGTIVIVNYNKINYEGIIININENDNIEDVMYDIEIAISADKFEYLKLKLNQFSIKFPSHVLFEPKLTLLPQEQLLQSLKEIKEIDLEIMRILNRNPDYLNSIHPGAFEDLVRKLYIECGYEVETVGNWNQGDGGVDLFAVSKNNDYGQIRFAIQCKRSKNKIQSKVLRELNGVLEHNKCHLGIVATTSYFTDDAILKSKNELWKIKLSDRDDVLQRLKLVLNK